MVKAVLTARSGSGYDDLIETRYHFPSQYLPAVQRALNDFILYYEPRRGGGRESYIAVAQVVGIEPDPRASDHHYASIANYLDFDQPVPWRNADGAYEMRLVKEDGSQNKGLFGWSVRSVSDQEFDAILAAGFHKDPWDQPATASEVQKFPTGMQEERDAFERPLVEQTLLRPFRDQAFRRAVRIAYENRCALTGISLINGGGRPEVQAAHIRAVEDNGPDSVRNGLALSGTMHWLFDRGLISVSEDFSILTKKGSIPRQVEGLLNPDGKIILPANEAYRPHEKFLKFHRENRFKS
jgi:putative restriction endonuclease